jgi:hypothetical protein
MHAVAQHDENDPEQKRPDPAQCFDHDGSFPELKSLRPERRFARVDPLPPTLQRHIMRHLRQARVDPSTRRSNAPLKNIDPVGARLLFGHVIKRIGAVACATTDHGSVGAFVPSRPGDTSAYFARCETERRSSWD